MIQDRNISQDVTSLVTKLASGNVVNGPEVSFQGNMRVRINWCRHVAADTAFYGYFGVVFAWMQAIFRHPVDVVVTDQMLVVFEAQVYTTQPKNITDVDIDLFQASIVEGEVLRFQRLQGDRKLY